MLQSWLINRLVLEASSKSTRSWETSFEQGPDPATDTAGTDQVEESLVRPEGEPARATPSTEGKGLQSGDLRKCGTGGIFWGTSFARLYEGPRGFQHLSVVGALFLDVGYDPPWKFGRIGSVL